MALATATPDGVPSVRFVLLKGIDERGVEFFTNYESPQGPRAGGEPARRAGGPVEAAAAPGAVGGRRSSVLTAGGVRRVLRDAAHAARSSAPGRRASREAIPDREWLEARLAEMDASYPARSRGRRTGAATASCRDAIEFWEGRPNRLHDRELFTRGVDGAWHSRRLSP